MNKKELASELLRRRKARENLIDFCEYVQPDYKAAKPHRLLAERLEQVESGEIKRLLVTAPPQHGKSRIVSVLFPCWNLGRNPKTKIVQTSYGLSLALKHSRTARDFFVSPEYNNLFPEVHHRPEKAGQNTIDVKRQAAQEWGAIQGGSYYAVGIGGGLTGMGIDCGIIDDPVKDVVEANSETISERNYEWYGQVFRTRLSPKASIIVTMTRWSQKDLMAKILDQINSGYDTEEWSILHMPAISVSNNLNDPSGRKTGEALWPEKYDIDWLNRQKTAIGSKAFESLYQGNPTIAEGEIFKREWWQYYSELPRLNKVIQSWDTAFKKGEQNDYSACTTWGLAKEGYYLIDIWKGKVEFPELIKQVKILANKHNPRSVLIEDKASGQSLLQTLKKETRLPIKAVKPDADKIARANAITGIIEAGKVYLPEQHEKLYDYIEELSSFPNGAHDDIVDSTVYALAELSGRSGSFNLSSIPMGFGRI